MYDVYPKKKNTLFFSKRVFRYVLFSTKNGIMLIQVIHIDVCVGASLTLDILITGRTDKEL